MAVHWVSRGHVGAAARPVIPLRTARVRGGEGPQAVERSFELAPQLEGVETLIERLELLAFRRGEHARGAETLIGRLRTVVDAMDPGALAGFRHELFDRLKEVHVQAGEPVDAGELSIGGFGGGAIIPNEGPGDGADDLLRERGLPPSRGRPGTVPPPRPLLPQ